MLVVEGGEVFLLLGPPDEMQVNHMPMNFREQDDARIKVFQRFAPDREGTTAKGSNEGGTQANLSPYQEEGGIPMPYSRRSEAARQGAIGSPSHRTVPPLICSSAHCETSNCCPSTSMTSGAVRSISS